MQVRKRGVDVQADKRSAIRFVAFWGEQASGRLSAQNYRCWLRDGSR